MNSLDTATPDPSLVLEVGELRTEFHLRATTVHAVDGVSFSVRAGECVGLVGESGCGKSTTGLSIMRLLPGVGHIGAGTIRLNGRDVVPLSEREMQHLRGNEVGMIFQDPMTALDPTMTIGRQIAEPVRLHRKASRRAARARALEVLQLVGIPQPEERIDNYPHQLSGGLRQRVMIAMALACEPKLLVADEPTTALDVTIQAQILDLIDDLRARLDMAVLLITHDLGVVAARTDRVMVMYAGEIVEGAPTDELFGSWRHPYTEALLESIPKLDADRSQRLPSIPGTPPDLSNALGGCRFAPRCRYATEECRAEEPLLSPDGGAGAPSPSARHATTPAPAEFGSSFQQSHVFACFHPLPHADAALDATIDATARAIPAPGTMPAAVPGTVVSSARAAERAESDRASAGQPAETALRVEHLVKEYPATSGSWLRRHRGTVKAVSDVSFTVEEGKTFGLVGESGCGKTTIGRLVVALERPTSGSVHFDGTDFTTLRGRELRRRRRDLQLMFQDPYASLDPRMRVGSIVREPLAIQGIGSAADQRRHVLELLSEVGLPRAAAERYPHEFSGGQRQRIGLARALALNPRMIVADEPVSALDVSIQAQILNLMRAAQQRHQLTYIVISHDLAVVRYLADDIGVMYLGKLVEVGPADAVYAHPAHPYTRGLIDTIPVPRTDGDRKRRAAVVGELPSAISPPSGCRFRTRCPRAQALCAEEEPQLRAFGNAHRAACHFPLETPMGDDAELAVSSR